MDEDFVKDFVFFINIQFFDFEIGQNIDYQVLFVKFDIL